jgi:hypothetical protein
MFNILVTPSWIGDRYCIFYKLFIALIKDTTYMTSFTINGNGELISKRDFNTLRVFFTMYG